MAVAAGYSHGQFLDRPIVTPTRAQSVTPLIEVGRVFLPEGAPWHKQSQTPNDWKPWNPTLAHRTRKDGAPTGESMSAQIKSPTTRLGVICSARANVYRSSVGKAGIYEACQSCESLWRTVEVCGELGET